MHTDSASLLCSTNGNLERSYSHTMSTNVCASWHRLLRPMNFLTSTGCKPLQHSPAVSVPGLTWWDSSFWPHTQSKCPHGACANWWIDEQMSPRVSLTWAHQHASLPQLNPPLQLCPFWSKQSAVLCIQQLWGLLKTQWFWMQGEPEPSRPDEQGGRRLDNQCSQRGVSTQERKRSLASPSAGTKVCLQLGNV